MNSNVFEVGEVVQLDYSPKMAIGTGTLVKITEVLSDTSVVVTTGCGHWLEYTKNIRKLDNNQHY